MLAHQISQASVILQNGGVIAYSTETVIGLGCDPSHQAAVNRILWLKNRAVENGLILLVNNITSLQQHAKPLSTEQVNSISSAENTTWLVPANEHVPAWVRGIHETLAVRITQHATANPLSTATQGIVSTSANISSYKILTSQNEIRDWFGPHVDYIIVGETGSNTPSEIKDLITGEKLR
ncbi:MAG: L-threonylcarbamoyladenylate synthase [Gammaproteobacteria bacterium]